MLCCVRDSKIDRERARARERERTRRRMWMNGIELWSVSLAFY